MPASALHGENALEECSMKHTVKFVAPLAAAMLLLAACGSAPEDTTTPATQDTAAESESPAADATTPEESTGAETSASDFLACMVSDSGGFDDKSFNQSGYEGLMKAKDELGIQTKDAESTSDGDFQPNLNNMVAEGCDLTFTVGYLLADATLKTATANPDFNFAIIDDSSIDLPNVRSLVFRTSEAAYLAGYVAAAQTKTGTVATFGGLQIPTVTIFMDGFVDGVARYNTDKGADIKVLGWDKEKQDGSFSGDFEDQSKGQNLTKSFIDQGADIIMPVAGPVGLGAAAAATEANASGNDVAIVWVDADGYETNPDYASIFLTSVVKEIGAAVDTTVTDAVQGGFTNAPYIGTLENGGVGIAPFHDFDSQVSEDTKAEIEQITADIIAGTTVVDSPSNP
jgi:basic membrane protein A